MIFFQKSFGPIGAEGPGNLPVQQKQQQPQQADRGGLGKDNRIEQIAQASAKASAERAAQAREAAAAEEEAAAKEKDAAVEEEVERVEKEAALAAAVEAARREEEERVEREAAENAAEHAAAAAAAKEQQEDKRAGIEVVEARADTEESLGAGIATGETPQAGLNADAEGQPDVEAVGEGAGAVQQEGGVAETDANVKEERKQKKMEKEQLENVEEGGGESEVGGKAVEGYFVQINAGVDDQGAGAEGDEGAVSAGPLTKEEASPQTPATEREFPPPRIATMRCGNTQQGEGRDRIANIAYWQDNAKDRAAPNPVASLGPKRKYVCFHQMPSGWNNVRMEMETVLAFAAYTGRTLVLPPRVGIMSHRGFDFEDFFEFEGFKSHINIISVEQFFDEIAEDPSLPQPSELVRSDARTSATNKKHMYAYFMELGALGNNEGGLPRYRPGKYGFVLPFEAGGELDPEDPRWEEGRYLGWLNTRQAVEYNKDMQDAPVIFFDDTADARRLTHFYTFITHSDKAVSNAHLRMMRDLLHYRQEVFCKASQVISMIKEATGGADFSTFHVRRGDFQKSYKRVIMSGEQLLLNSQDYLKEGETIYIATDEKDMSYFEPLRARYTLLFLDDFFERAGVGELASASIPMVDSIIAAQGRTFTGTYFSTFSGYIVRLRGYYGHPLESNWNFFLPKQKDYHERYWPVPPFWMREWPVGWEDIDEVAPLPPLSDVATVEVV